MALPPGLNDLAKLMLLASDASYFDNAKGYFAPTQLGALKDTNYGVEPQYSIPPGFLKELEFHSTPTTGFGFVAYVKRGATSAETEVIIALRGTDGLNPTDWVSNSQYWGWNQWNSPAGRAQVFAFLDSLKTNPLDQDTAFQGTIHFTGQSLGGGLAQYAAYDYVLSHQELTGFSKANITLTTFNGFGAALGFKQNAGGYNSDVLNDIGSNAHFYTEGDLVSRLGWDSVSGFGHTGGTAYFLSVGSSRIDPDTGEPFLLNAVDAHRIETGFYPFLNPGVEFEVAVARPIDYLPVTNVTQIAALFGRILNNQNVSPIESIPRLAAGLIAALSLGDSTETNALVQAVLTNLHSSDNMPDKWYVALRSLDWGKIAQNPAFQLLALPGYGVILLGAILSDALQFQVDRHVQLFNSLRDWVSPAISTPDLQVSSEDRRVQMDMLFSLIPGAAIGSKFAPVLQPLGVDVEAFAQRVVSNGENWVSETFKYLREQAQGTLADTSVGSFVVKLASKFAEVALSSGMAELTVQGYLDSVIVPMIRDTANGTANAVSEFVQDIPNTLFNFGRTISNLADVQLIDQAYAAELNDPRLSSSIRAAAEEAREIVQRAGQTVVIATGMGVNPFDTPGFVPGGASSATVEEKLGQVFRLSLPFAAGTGGQQISLQLQGPQVNQLSVLTENGVQAIGANGTFELTVPEGTDQVYFTLNASDGVSSNATVTLSATLVDTTTGVATHTPQVESVVSVNAFVGNTDQYYQSYVEDWSSLTDPNVGVPMGGGGFYHLTLIGGAGPDYTTTFNGFGDDAIYGNGGNDSLIGGMGHDRLFGGDGDDYLVADQPDDDPLPEFNPTGPTRSTQDGKDFVDGGNGNDLLAGGGNADRLIGGAGDDFLWGDAYTTGIVEQHPDGSVTIINLTGVLRPDDDVLDGGEGNDYLSGDGGADTLDGGVGDDVLWGDSEEGLTFLYAMTPGDDFLTGDAGNDQLAGGAGDDVLLGGSGKDLLFGDDESVGVALQGDDWLEGGEGDDQLSGRGGNDTLLGGNGIDVLFGGDGNDTLDGGEGADAGFGGAGDDEIVAGAGADQFDGEDGDDFLIGDEGNDLLIGGAGIDRLDGGADNDLLLGGADADTVFGGDGNDELQGESGNDFLSGDAGDDRLFGQESDDELFGGDGNDGLRGDNGADQLDGGAGDDILVGDADGQIGGTGGNDVLIGGAGNDTLVGGGGQDTYVYGPGDGADTIADARGEGNRLVFGPGISLDGLTLGVASGALVMHVGSSGQTLTIGGFDAANVDAGSGINTYQFADGTVLTHEQLVARGFAFTGSLGGDVLTGATNGLNKLAGGAGDDTYIVNHVTDQVLEASNEGIDAVHTSVDFTLSDFVENLFAAVPEGSSSAPVALTGNNLSNMIQALPGLPTDNRLQGRGGNDQILAFEGNDILEGGAGEDMLDGGSGSDTYVFGMGDGVDVVIDQSTAGTDIDTIQFGPGVVPSDVRVRLLQGQEPNEFERAVELGSGVDKMILRNASIEQMAFADGTIWDAAAIEARTEGLTLRASQTGSSLSGTVYRDTLIGEGGDDFLDGNENADRMVGGAGDDRYRVDHSGDVVVEADGEGADTVFSLVDYTLPDQVENLILRGTGQPAADPVRGEGNADANQLLGNFVSNLLIGGAGADVLWGGFSIGSDYGPGDDDLSGGTGNDTYVVEGEFNGFDTIHDIALPGEGNRLQFGNSIRPGDVVFAQEGSSLRITNAGGTDGVVLADFDPSGMTGSLVAEVVAFGSGVEDVTGGYETRLLALMNPSVWTDQAETLTGTSNAEVMKGQGGDDVMEGGAGNDVLIGGTGNDTYVLNPGDGFDLIDDQSGSGDVNLVQFGAGITQDMLHVWYSGTSSIGGLMVRVGMSGDGLHFLGVSAEDPAAPHAIDTFSFVDGTHLSFAQLFDHEVLVQGTGRSDGELFGTVADDRMVGLAGSESLSSGAGSDTLIGGPGNDVLDGGEGGDTYVFNPGDGIDEIRDDIGDPASPDVNRLRFGTGITASDLALFTNGDGITVNRVAVGTSGDEISLPNFADFIPALTVAEFADGVTLDLYNLYAANLRTDNQTIVGGEGELVLIGGTGNDTILGGSSPSTLLGGMGDDVLVGADGTNLLMGGRGSDFIQGGAGHDTYLFNLGDGIDTIQDVEAVGAGNHIQFGAGILQNNLIFTRDEATRTLTIQVGASGTDRLVLTNFDPTGANGSLVVETLVFADGSTASLAQLLGLGGPVATNGDDTFTTGSGNDVIDALGGNDTVDAGAGNDTLTGGSGNDTLSGGSGDDTYIFNAGDGTDTINDTSLPGEGNTVQFGRGIDPAGLNLDLGSLLIRVGTNGDALHLTTFDSSNALSPRTIENFRFADGTVLSYDQLIARGFDLTGTVGDDQITGTNVVDRISGLAGRDTIQAGAGNDLLNGGLGSDTYLFNLGDGIDTIQDVATAGEGNRIQFGAGITQNNLTFTRDEAARTLTIQVGSSGTDKLFLTNFDPTGANGSLMVETLIFADGNMVNLADLFVNHAPRVTNPLADQIVPEDAPFSFVVPATTFADQDAGDGLTLSASLADGTVLPGWLSFGASTAMFSGTPDDAQVGSLDLRVTATDREDLNVSDVFRLTVANVNEAPTVAVPLANQTAVEDTAVTFAVPESTFTDVDLGDVLTYSATLAEGSPLPAWLNFNSTTQTFSGAPGTGDAGSLQIAMTATDSGNLSATDQFAFAISGPLPQTLRGTSGNDVLIGGRGDDTLTGLAGNDTLIGGLGHDLFDGGTGTDTMQGGAGNDTYVVDAAGDVVTELANEGTDMVQSALLAYTLGADIENLTLTGTGQSAGIGNALSNVLTGNSGANLLDGKGGADAMAGGAGDDLYMVDHTGDTVIERANEGALDSVTSSVSYALSENVENLVLTGTAAIVGTGNELDNVLTGNSAANVLVGLGGNDTYVIGAGDTVVEAVNEGTDRVISGITHTLATNVENLTLIGFSAINGTGNALDNVLNGLLNLASNTLTGGAGNDTYILGSGDQVVEAATEGIDTVQSSLTYTLGANVENLTLTGFSAVNGTGNSLNNTMTGNSANNTLSGANGNDTLRGGLGNDTVRGGSGNDAFLFGRGEGQDLIQDTSGTADKILYDAGINPLDLVISRQANDLRLTIHGTTDRVTVQNWYSAPTTAQIETIQAGNGQTMLSAQVDQLIQAMAGFTQQTGLTWDQAIDQRPQEVQAVLAASWQ
jgi:Ca2+-binding RTX toxin-like protein